MKTKFIFSLLLVVGITSCKKLDFDDPTRLTNTEAATQITDLGLKLANSSVQRALFNTTESYAGVAMAGLADQVSMTNRFQEWWDFCEEPRKRISNSNSYGGYENWNYIYGQLYQANLDATTVIDIAVVQNKPVKTTAGVDRTADAITAAYFAKGLAQGHLGVMFDRGIIVDQVGLSTRDYPASYKQMIENGVANLDKAIAAANANASFTFDFIQANPLTKAQFIAICNSYAARFLASIPRSKAEATALGTTFWNRVYTYANAGVTTDFTTTYVTGGVFNEAMSQCLVRGSANQAGYAPVDIKVAQLADNTGTYPNYYPAAPAILNPITTSDARFTQYFEYTTNFLYLRADRNRGLFSNYIRKRWWDTANTLALAGKVSPWVLAEEMRFLKAEAKLWTGDAAAAAALLNDASARRKSVGLLPNIAATEADVRKALHYEYAIELDLAAGNANPFAFMRRNDLLIGGTPTQFPVPAGQLDLLLQPNYTFGGKLNAGELGKYGEVATAPLTGGWKASQ